MSWYGPAGFGSSVLPDAADQYFRLERVALNGEATLDPGLAVLVMLTGDTDVDDGRTNACGKAATQQLRQMRPDTSKLHGRGELLACRPPLATVNVLATAPVRRGS